MNMEDPSLDVPEKKSGCGKWLISILVLFSSFLIVQFFIDKNNYSLGHQYYLQEDCKNAIYNFDKVIDSFRFFDFGDYSAHAYEGKEECLPFLSATEKQERGEFSSALVSYTNYSLEHRNSVLTEAAIKRIAALFTQANPSELASNESCGKLNYLLAQDLIPLRDKYLPPFYLACGKVYESLSNDSESFSMYEAFLSEYSNHSLAREAEARLLSNQLSCENHVHLKNNKIISSRNDFLPTLYFGCGQAYEEVRDWANAIVMYDLFIDEYPYHKLAKRAEEALARSIVKKARASGAGEIPAPESSGRTETGTTEVIIQNDSPDRLRIVFSGPDTLIAEVDACTSCTKYFGKGPTYCPELGPIGHYTLTPGQYDIVVESNGDTGTTPWAGTWDLVNGDEYSSCFFIVSTFYP